MVGAVLYVVLEFDMGLTPTGVHGRDVWLVLEFDMGLVPSTLNRLNLWLEPFCRLYWSLIWVLFPVLRMDVTCGWSCCSLYRTAGCDGGGGGWWGWDGVCVLGGGWGECRGGGREASDDSAITKSICLARAPPLKPSCPVLTATDKLAC